MDRLGMLEKELEKEREETKSAMEQMKELQTALAKQGVDVKRLRKNKSLESSRHSKSTSSIRNISGPSLLQSKPPFAQGEYFRPDTGVGKVKR
jgi:hypothetical protein